MSRSQNSLTSNQGQLLLEDADKYRMANTFELID